MACGMGWRKNTRAHTGARGHVGVEVPRECSVFFFRFFLTSGVGSPKEPTGGVLGWIFFFGADVGDVGGGVTFFFVWCFFGSFFFSVCSGNHWKSTHFC